MRVLLPLVFAAAFAWHQERHDAPTLRGVDARRILKGKFERRGAYYGKKAGEIIGYAVGNGLGTLTSAALGTVTGGNIGTRSGRSGLAAGGGRMGKEIGTKCIGKACAAVGRQIDKFTKTGKQAEATAANKAKRTPVELPPKGPILHTGAGYKKLDRTASSPSAMQRGANRATTARGKL
ncbi:unnamed protein product [Aphanomyces euteiches]|uniref:Glycine zipper 2TM domain-containing protein n=1 Tax=Aphanomyces euteiches TaxID=100861 RepID=A0A6G0WBX5_9STRA|nr:hypothetical protein Ae201684_017130 [Aphanomyces euteiches]KAH9073998.1 hypothetical protein Ae201684P_015897 [Aphanomyces euteiches]KAH9143273.1 hypothetical protein AeRB84_012708 [Aphanomyces euteiches]